MLMYSFLVKVPLVTVSLEQVGEDALLRVIGVLLLLLIFCTVEVNKYKY
jgi:hypothetical protein